MYSKETNQGNSLSSSTSNALTPMPRDVLDEEILALLQDLLMEGETNVTQNSEDGELISNPTEHKIKKNKNRLVKFPLLQLNPNILTFTQQVTREIAQNGRYRGSNQTPTGT